MNEAPLNRFHPLGAAVGVVLVLVGLAILDIEWYASVVFRSVALALAIGFAVRYSRPAGRWRQTPEGRHIMAFTVLVAVFLAYATLNHVMALIGGTWELKSYYPGQHLVGAGLYMAVAWKLWERNILLTRANRETRSTRLAGR